MSIYSEMPVGPNPSILLRGIDTRYSCAAAVRSVHIAGIHHIDLLANLESIREIAQVGIRTNGEGDRTIARLEDK